MYANPETVISQEDFQYFKRRTFDQITEFRPSNRHLNVLDFDAISLKKFRCPGVEKLASVVKYEPHNFPYVAHLDLADTYYTRTLLQAGFQNVIFGQTPRAFTPFQHRSMYEDMCARKVAVGILRSIYTHPGQIVRLLRAFIDYTHCTECVLESELINITRFCLKALHHQLHPDGNLVSDILLSFCRTQLHKEDIVNSGDYTHECIEYVLESCRRVQFDFQYFLRHSLRGRILGFCPIRTCVLNAERNLPRIRAFLQYGFEPLELNGSMRTAIYLGLRLSRQMRSKQIHPLNAPHLHRFYIGDRRSDFTMELFYMVFGSLGSNRDVWVDCAKFFFNSILDPLLCKDEITSVLEALCHSQDRPTVIQALDTFFEDLVVEQPTPRTLKHLARYRIRRVLKSNYRLPEGIHQLDIPRTLFAYLKLED